jgi:hypothetical protein
VFTLLSGLVIGLVATIAVWFGARSRRGGGPGRSGGPFGGFPDDGRQDRRPGGTVIDVEMREIEPGSSDGHPREPEGSDPARPVDADPPERPDGPQR